MPFSEIPRKQPQAKAFGLPQGRPACHSRRSLQRNAASCTEGERLGKPRQRSHWDPLDSSRSRIVNQCLNDSTEESEDGDEDFTGPWNRSNRMVMAVSPSQPIAEATAVEVKKEMKKAVR